MKSVYRAILEIAADSNLSALGISGEDKEKQQHFCHCSSPFYSAACVGSLLSVAMFGLHL